MAKRFGGKRRNRKTSRVLGSFVGTIVDTTADRMPRILLVDDEENIQCLYKAELEDDGYEVICAGDGEEALRIVDETVFDLITLDLKMPRMDGLDFLEALRRRGVKTPVVVCSAYPSYKQNYHSWGAEGYVVKSSDLTELRETIRSLLDTPKKQPTTERIELVNDAPIPDSSEPKEPKAPQGSTLDKKQPVSVSEECKTIIAATAHGLKREFMHIAEGAKALRKRLDSSEDMQGECDNIERYVRYGELMLRRLLDYLEVGLPQHSRVRLAGLLSRVENLCRPRLPSSIALKLDTEACLEDVVLWANDQQLIMVLMDLLQNSIDALRDQGCTVSISVARKDNTAIISVMDDGPGIPLEIETQLFQQPVPGEEQGLGIGLFLGRKVVQQMGGNMELKTVVGKGTSVSISLPLATVDEE